MNKHALVLSVIETSGTNWKAIVSKLGKLATIKEGDWGSVRSVIQSLKNSNLIYRTNDLREEVYIKNCLCLDCLEKEEEMLEVKKGKFKGCFFCKECLNWRGLSSAIVKAYKKHINEGVK